MCGYWKEALYSLGMSGVRGMSLEANAAAVAGLITLEPLGAAKERDFDKLMTTAGDMETAICQFGAALYVETTWGRQSTPEPIVIIPKEILRPYDKSRLRAIVRILNDDQNQMPPESRLSDVGQFSKSSWCGFGL